MYNRQQSKIEMEGLQKVYEELIPNNDQGKYKQMKERLDQFQKTISNLLEISCNIVISNPQNAIQKETHIKSCEQFLKKQFKIVNSCRIRIQPEFQYEFKFDPQIEIDTKDQQLSFMYSRNQNQVEQINKSNTALYQFFKLQDKHSLYRYTKQKKYYFLILEQSINIQVADYLIKLFFPEKSKQVNENILNIISFMTNNFQIFFQSIISQYFTIQNKSSLSSLIIKGNPIMTLMISKLYRDYQRLNSIHKRTVFSSITLKSPNRMIMFYKQNFLYTNHKYLNTDLKKMIVDKNYPKFQFVVKQLEYSDKEYNQIISKYKTIGYHQSSSKKWVMIVDKEWIEFTFQIQPARRLGIINKQQKGYLDLFTTSINELNNLNSNKKAFKISIVQPFSEQDQKQIMSIDFKHIQAIKRIDQFEFNILDYEPQVAGVLSYEILIARFPEIDIDKPKLQQFIRKVSYLYQKFNNTFHNIYHMFTVLHGAYIMSKSNIFKELFKVETIFTYLVAALCHDIAHTGVTNAFEEKIESRLANRYGDRSVLQSNSISEALKLLSNQKTNFLINFPEKTWRDFRKLFVSGILATDNKNHLAVLTDFQSAAKQQAPLQSQAVHKLIGGLLHTADFWGNIKYFKASYNWSKRVNQQFSKQYERQLQVGVQLTPYFKDLNNIKVIAKNQQLFTTAIISPLYRRVNEWSDGHISLAIERITTNTEKWKQIQTGNQTLEFFLQ